MIGSFALLAANWPAWAADANNMHTRDGGEFLMLQEEDPGGRWMPWVAVSVSEARDLVVEADDTGRSHSVLQAVDTTEVGASIRLDDDARVGIFIPYHTGIFYDEQAFVHAFGDAGAWVQLSLLQRKYVAFSAVAEVDLPTGPEQYFLGDAWGAFRAGGELGVHWERWSALMNAGAKLTGGEELEGLGWGARIEYGAGLRRAIWGPVGVGMELQGSLPLGGRWNEAGAIPLEGMFSVGAITPVGLGARLAAGAGLTHGFGSPSSRIMAELEFRHVSPPDLDKDGINDARDGCVDDPEDRDGIVDADGCPEFDADSDGFSDKIDICPLDPETVNGAADEDGCPDKLFDVRVRVVSADSMRPLETAEVWMDEHEHETVLEGDAAKLDAGVGGHTVHASAALFDASDVAIEVVHDMDVSITLTPTQFGDVKLRFVDEAGVPLSVTLRDAQEHLTRVPDIGLPVHIRVGPHTFKAYAPGFKVESVEIDATATPMADQVITLHPSPIRVTGSRIAIGDTLFFAPDSSRFDPAAVAPLFAIARLLQDEPTIQVLRIEGHADETGSSRHNLVLSRARAAAVLDWLVRAGVDADRLEAIGSGEANLTPGEGGTRTVEFVILAWAEE